MNTRITTRVKICTEHVRNYFSKRQAGGFLASLVYCGVLGSIVLTASLISSEAWAEWKIDLSRRQKTVRDQDFRRDTSAVAPTEGEEEKGFFGSLFDSGEPVQEVVIINTEKGFLPATVRMRKGGKYLVHVVNVNEKEKNISFVLDSFSEHHATFYGKVKTFTVEPKKEGIYSFQCPETSFEGRVVVFSTPGSSAPAPMIRGPASEEVK